MSCGIVGCLTVSGRGPESLEALPAEHFATGRRSETEGSSPLRVAYLIALGIGFHNLGDGLSVGAAYASGQAALGTFLVIGFTLHNVTEGIGIAAPVADDKPRFHHFVYLTLLAGAPAIAGTWLGSYALNPVIATIFLSAGVGAILQVIWEVGKLIGGRDGSIFALFGNWKNLVGFALGIAIMYITGYFVAIYLKSCCLLSSVCSPLRPRQILIGRFYPKRSRQSAPNELIATSSNPC